MWLRNEKFNSQMQLVAVTLDRHTHYSWSTPAHKLTSDALPSHHVIILPETLSLIFTQRLGPSVPLNVKTKTQKAAKHKVGERS